MEHLSPIADDGPSDRTTTFVDRVARAQQGDRSAAGRLLADNRSWLRRKAERMLSRRAKVEAAPSDVVQECLAAAGQHLPEFRGGSISAFRAWLGAIMVNTVRGVLRRNRQRITRQVRLPDDCDDRLVRLQPNTTALERLQRDEERAQLHAALLEIDADDRNLVIAHFLQEMKYANLTALFGMTEESLRQKGRRAVAKLERAQRLLAALERKHMPPHYRKVLCAVRLRQWPVAQIATEFGLSEEAVRRLIERAEAWLQSPGGKQ